MTDKQTINLRPMEDLNEKIIKEKGNTKCIFYADDICRNGDKTRDCANCARVEYHSLYSLNWDNQARLQKVIKQKEQECEELKKELDFQKSMYECARADEKDKFEEILELKQTLAEIKPILEFYANSKMGEEQPDRTYKIMLSGGYIMAYDPKPAREALRKINEVEDEG